MRQRGIVVLGVGLSVLLMTRSADAQCQPGRGGTLVSEGNRFEVRIIPGNPGAVFTSDLYLAIPGKPAINFGTNRDVGRVTQLGKIDVGTEVIFKITVRNTGDTFFSGPASRNPDGVAHADVECLANGVVRFSFEDLRGGGDQSYNDLRFEVKPKGCGSSTSTAETEQITGFASCGPARPLLATWGRFGSRMVLESDEGEKLELECKASQVNYYALYYTGPSTPKTRVGICPFEAGCNEAFFVHSGDADGNGKPDCFLLTSWLSKDYGANDNPNPWTSQTESTPVLDHARSVYDVVANNLTKTNLKFAYAVPPPIPCVIASRAEGRSLGSQRVDPPLGPETEAFFQAAVDRLAALPGPHEPMQASPLSPADLNGDGRVDDTDAAQLEAALGRCEGTLGYDAQVDFDSDGCVTFADQQIFEDLRAALSDTTPPELSLAASPALLWPPNHELVPVAATVTVTDDTDPGPTVQLVSITCDDGCDPASDVADAATGTDDRDFRLRAERAGQGGGRTYTITYSAADGSGNRTTAQTTVTVPHDQGGGGN
jgi:hypothetical protein